MTEIKRLIEELSSISAVSGREDEAFSSVSGYMEKYYDCVRLSRSGSIICSRLKGERTPEDAPVLMLDAHLDEIGMMVKELCPGGLLSVSLVGGPDIRSLSGADVTVFGKRNIPGVIAAEGGDDGSLPDADKLRIFTGLDEDELHAIVSPGDSVGFAPGVTSLHGSFCGKSFDNRASMAAVIRALELLGGDSHGYDIVTLFSSGEETGMRGAKTGAYEISPDLAIVIDVGFARVPDTEESETLVFGGGPSVSLSAVTDRGLTRELAEAAEKHGEKCQRIVEAMGTGTNANVIPLMRGGIPTAVVSIPLKNMHTQSEVICGNDIESTARLIVAFIKDGKKIKR